MATAHVSMTYIELR